MTLKIFISALIVILCIISHKLSHKSGVPALLLFILLGMLFGSDGLFKISYDNFVFAEQICSIALIFIMFYGGFGTNWKSARPVATKAFLLSSIGVILTAGLTGLFCHLVLKMSLLEGMLVGSVIGSTDAASVFSILRSKKLNLKHGLASLLELESGSNDPTAYTLTAILLSLMSNPAGSNSALLYLAFSQIAFGLACGFLIAFASVFLMKRISFGENGMYTIFTVAVALLAYSVPTLIGGNGYLSVYIAGIVLGNSKIQHKIELVHFFDGLTGIMQILIFFSLGLLAFPSQMPHILLPSILIALFLTFVARPAAVFALLSPFRIPFRQQLLVSWAGLRGAASIVFAIFAMNSGTSLQYDIFHIVFCVSLLSVAFQGTLLPAFARKLMLVDDKEPVLKTFNDYQDPTNFQLIQIEITENHPWANRKLKQVILPEKSLVVVIKRDGKNIMPKGHTEIHPGDTLIVNSTPYFDDTDIRLVERVISKKHPWANQRVNEIHWPAHTLIVMIKRGDLPIIPKGNTRILPEDVLVLSYIENESEEPH